MGWWSDDIMGGDTPSDCFSTICETVGVKYDGSNPGVFTAEVANENLDKLTELAEKEESEFIIMRQVIGFKLMMAGAKMPARIRELAIIAAQDDEWVKEEGAVLRKKVMDRFIESLEAYNKDGGPEYAENYERIGIINKARYDIDVDIIRIQIHLKHMENWKTVSEDQVEEEERFRQRTRILLEDMELYNSRQAFMRKQRDG